MLKVILVDDENIILQGLAYTYDWEKMGYEVAGMASSGEQAVEMIREQEVDVVLTDISMEGMSGLDLLEEGRKIRKDIDFVMISAYKDFEYARQACDKGAFAYLVKPIEEDKLEEIMEAIRRKIEEREEERKKYNDWKRLLLDSENDYQEMLLQKYLKNILSLEEFSRILSLTGSELSPTSCFSVVCADFDISYKIAEQLQYEMNRIELFQELKKELQSRYQLWAICGSDRLSYILRLKPGQDVKCVSQIVTDMQKRMKYRIVSAVTPVYAGGEGLKQAFTQAEHFFAIANTAGASFFEPDITVEKEEGADTYSVYSEQAVLHALRKNDNEQIKETFKKYISTLPSGKSEDYQKACLIHLLSAVELDLENTYGMTDDMKKSIRIVFGNSEKLSVLKMVDILYQLLLKISKNRIERQTENVNSYFTGYIEKAKEYIENSLSDPELSIGDVAQAVYLNPVYFGRVFKASCGMSFKRYLLQQRIEAAKKLLLEEFSINETCEKVGIWNPSYFAQVFKQTTGCLPSEYRKQIK